MKHAFLIQAHQYPEQLYRLVIALNSPNNTFYIHVDKKNSNFMSSEYIYKLYQYPQVYFIQDRIKVYWGGFSQIMATLKMLKEAINGDFDYFHLLSGVDYPLKSTEYIDSFFRNSCNKNFLRYNPEESMYWYRMERYYFHDFLDWRKKNKTLTEQIQRRFFFLVEKFVAVLVQVFKMRIRKNLHMNYYHGSNWFSLTNDAVKYIISFLEKNTWILKRFEYTAFSDESFFIMLLMNNSQFKNTVVNDDLRLRNENGELNRNGYILTEKDYERITHSTALWGRKVIPGLSDLLCSLIDKNILHISQ